MKTYTQRPTTIPEQSALLSARGVSGDCNMLTRILECVGYYRLRGFLFPFMKEDGCYDTWITVQRLWKIYTLDRRVRMTVFDCIGRLEVAFRTRFSNEHALMTHDAFCYMHESALDLSSGKRVTEFSRFRDRIERSKEKSVSRLCIQRFCKNYDSDSLPVWIITEIMDFGLLLHYFNLLPKKLRISIANSYGVTDKTFLTWLTILNMTRNACAHHESLIFKRFPTQTIKRYCKPANNPLLQDLSDALEPTNESEGIGLYSVLSLL